MNQEEEEEEASEAMLWLQSGAQWFVLSDRVQAQKPLKCSPGRNRAAALRAQPEELLAQGLAPGEGCVPKGTDGAPMLC